jgi:hypothetical protein
MNIYYTRVDENFCRLDSSERKTVEKLSCLIFVINSATFKLGLGKVQTSRTLSDMY